ncbi:MAG: hypothetical protein RLY87_128 [Chloroflexota bacterium]
MDLPHCITMIAPFGIRPKGTLLARMLPLAKALTRAGMQVVIVAPPVHNPQDAGTQQEYDGVVVRHTNVPHLPGFLGVCEQAWLLVQAVLRTSPDCVYLFKPKGHAGLAAQWLRWTQPQMPMVVDCDDREGTGGWNDVLPYPLLAKWLFAWQERSLPRRADAVTVASRALQTLCWADGCVPDGVVYLPNAADLDAHPNSLSAKDSLRLVLYTRFWEFDAAMLVAVLAELFAAHPAVHLDVIGTGENGEEQQFATMLAHAGLSARVTMHGWVQPAQITPLLRVAAIALVPVADTLINRSRCSAKLLELLAAGIAVVGHDVGEMQTFVDHDVNGILVPAGDNSAFARALLSLVENPQRLSAMQEAAAESARLHQWDARVASCHTALQIAFTRAHARNRKR